MGIGALSERHPLVIAHGQGNTANQAEAALTAGADLLEIDLWLHRGAFEARHERRFPWPLPILFEKWYLKLAARRPMNLERLIALAAGRSGIFLDLKNGGAAVVPLVLSAAKARPGVAIAASSQHWGTLRALAQQAPEVALYYSVAVQAQLDLFLSVQPRDARPAGISCRHPLLTPPVLAELRARDLEVVAWTVDDPDRAAELAALGVTAITTDRVPEIVARLRP